MRLPTFLLVVSALLATTPLSGCRPSAAPATLIYGTLFEPSRLNPITAPEVHSKAAIELVFDALVAVNEKMEIVPDLADSWEVSPDGRVYTFHLHPGVRWHDGRPFTAADVKFTYDTIRGPDPSTIAKSDYAPIERIEVLDDLTVRFFLKEANASFLSKLTIGIAPRHILADQDLKTTEFNRKPIGTGPFLLEEWASGQKMSFRANPNYFRGRPAIEQIVWRFLKDSNVLTVQLLGGEVDAAQVMDSRDLDRIKASNRLTTYETVGANLYIGFQLENPLFQDKRVRQALNYALDKRSIVEQIARGMAIPSTGDIMPNSWAYNPNVNRYQRDVAKARDLLSQAGWRLGPDGVLVREGKRFRFTLLTNAGDKVREEIALFARQQWREIGVEMEPQFLELNTFLQEHVLKGNFEAILLQTSVAADPDISRRYHSASLKTGHNFLRYSNPEVDRLLEQGLATTAQEERRPIYFRIQEILTEDVPQIPIYYPKTTYAFSSNVRGVNPTPMSLFWNVETWKMGG